LQIKDYGRGISTIGFKEPHLAESPGVGIAGMRQRLRQFGGTLEIESSDRGSVVTARMPIAARAQEGDSGPDDIKRASA
jgi:signal transduction histidine kinase